MARRRRKATRRWLLPLGVLAAVALALWGFRQRVADFLLYGGHGAPLRVASDHVDAANEGRRVRVSGALEVAGPARDAELGVSAAAAVLIRRVEMYQWQEHCRGSDCSYAAAWSTRPVDSHGFRHAEGHENPPQRLKDGVFAGQGMHLGAYSISAGLAAAQLESTGLVVHVAELTPNLAASFSDYGGALYTGGDPAHPQVGAMRVSYRVVPAGRVDLTGVQRGQVLAAQ
jgi:Transmembrane protein 43